MTADTDLSCARCDWEPSTAIEAGPDVDQLARHAEEEQHPLCGACGWRSLPDEDPHVCTECVDRVRAALTEVVELYAVLPDQLGHPAPQVYDRDGRSSGDEQPIPGGAALVLLGPGSNGTAARKLTSKEQAEGATGREHGVDNDDRDPVSVAHTLGSWEDTWRHARGEPANPEPATVTAAAGYLDRHLTWAARSFAGEPLLEFAHDLRWLRAVLRAATGQAGGPLRAPARCFRCGQDELVRRSRKPDQCGCGDQRPGFELLTLVAGNPPIAVRMTPADVEARHEAWARTHAKHDQGGLADTWVCGHCGHWYDQGRYYLAVSERARQAAEERKRQRTGTR